MNILITGEQEIWDHDLSCLWGVVATRWFARKERNSFFIWERPEVALQVSMDGTRNVLESARTHGVQCVVFSSTVATYGPGLPEPLLLDAPSDP